jgi:hypothetical protein
MYVFQPLIPFPGATLAVFRSLADAQNVAGYVSNKGLNNVWIDAKETKQTWTQVAGKSTIHLPDERTTK